MSASRLASAEQNSGGYLQAATAQAFKYKALFYKIDMRLQMDRAALEDLSQTYQGLLSEQERVGVELQVLRLDLADCEVKVDHLSSQSLDWKQKYLSAIRDRDVIRTHVAQLDFGTSLPSFWGPVCYFRYSPIKQEIQVYGTRSSDQASTCSRDDAIRNGVGGYPFHQLTRWVPTIHWACEIRHIIRIHWNTPRLCAIFQISSL